MATSSGSCSGHTSSSTGTGTAVARRRSAGPRPSSRLLGPQPVAIRAQLGDRGAELGDGLVEQAVHVDRAAEVALREPQGHAERDEPLLGAVVQVALQPAALGVARLQQPRPARLDLAQRLAELAAQPDQLDQQPAAAATSRSSARERAHRAGAPICAPPHVHRHPPPGRARPAAAPSRSTRPAPARQQVADPQLGVAQRASPARPPAPPAAPSRRRRAPAGVDGRQRRPAQPGRAGGPPGAAGGCAAGRRATAATAATAAATAVESRPSSAPRPRPPRSRRPGARR